MRNNTKGHGTVLMKTAQLPPSLGAAAAASVPDVSWALLLQLLLLTTGN